MKNLMICIVIIFVAGFYIFLKLIDFDIEDMGRSTTPFNLQWYQEGKIKENVSNDLMQCRQFNSQYKVSFKIGIDMDSLCMIRKGYKFSPRGDGNYRNWCHLETKSVACLFYDGKIILNQQGQVVWKKTGAEVRIDEEGIVK